MDLNIPGLNDILKDDMKFDHDSDGDEDGLEDELEAILSGKSVGRKARPSAALSGQKGAPSRPTARGINQPRSAPGANRRQQRPGRSAPGELDFNEIEKLAHIGQDNDDDMDDDDDDSLEAELTKIVGRGSPEKRATSGLSNNYTVPTNERQTMNTDVRRSSGQGERTFPPLPQAPPRRVAPSVPQSGNRPLPTPMSEKVQPRNEPANDSKSKVTRLRDEYKKAAFIAKNSNDKESAISFLRTSKQLDVLIQAIEENKPVDLTSLPPLPSYRPTSQNQAQVSRASLPPPPPPPVNDVPNLPDVELNHSDAEKLFHAPPPPKSIEDALQQRLDKFKTTQEQATTEGNTSKARRLGRILKQYETAIKDHKAGKPVNFDELPVPPGFGDIPISSLPATAPAPQPKPQPKPQGPPPPPPQQKPQLQRQPQATDQQPKTMPRVSQPARPSVKRGSSMGEKQLSYLTERQTLFRDAAREAKNNGDIQQAKEYLRCARGFDPLIDATKSGLPIDATSIPTPPQLSDDFVIVSHADTESYDSFKNSEREEIYRKLEVDLQKQVEMCRRNKEHFLKLGDVSASSKFEKCANDSIKDLDMLRVHWTAGKQVPLFKYETRCFSIVICNTDVGFNEVAVEVLKAFDLPGRNDIDTYVKVEFPFPADAPPTSRTKTVKDSVNPVYNEVFKYNLDRKSRSLVRVLKRHPAKLEIWAKGGFLRSDYLIGCALVKMSDLEAKCTIHDTFQLVEGRKMVGGRVEAKIRIREPLSAKQVEEVKEKWLSFS